MMKSTAVVLLMAAGFGSQSSQAFPNTARPQHHHSQMLQDSPSSSSEDMILSADLEQAMERKNKSRLNFGLKPLTGPQFLELQQQIAELDHQQELVYLDQQQQQQNEKALSKQSNNNFIKQLFQKSLEDTCLTSFDCESPKVCCDLGFKKMCCSNGMMEVRYEYAMLPVPVDMRE